MINEYPRKKIRHWQLLALATFFVSVSTYAQSPSFINYSIKEGLPSNETYDIYQDRKGFIWFATDNGVVRFDGESLKLFHTKDGLADPVIFGFHEDPVGQVWFRSYSGKLSYYSPESQKITSYKYNDKILPYTERDYPSSIYVDEKSLWIGLTRKFLRIDSTGRVEEIKDLALKTFQFETIRKGFLVGLSTKDESIDSIIVDSRAYAVKLSHLPLTSSVVCALRVDDRVLFSIGHDLFEVKDNRLTRIFVAPAPILNLFKDNERHIWLGLRNKGALLLTPGGGSTMALLTDKSVSKIFQDRDNNYWLATLENGIYYFPSLNIKSTTFEGDRKISAVASYNGDIFFGDHQGLVQSINHPRKIQFNAPILSLFPDGRDKLWISTSSAISILNSDFTEFKKIGNSSKVAFSADTDHVWGAGAISTKFDRMANVMASYKTKIYRSIAVQDAHLILSGRLGLEVRDKEFQLLKNVEGVENFKINHIAPLGNHFTILSTIGNGLVLLRDLEVQRKYDSQDNFVADNVNSMMRLGDSLWVGTNKGLVVIDIPSLLQGSMRFVQLNRKNGLLEEKINFLTSDEFNVWAFSDNGISIVPKTSAATPRPEPEFYIKQVLVNDQERLPELSSLSFDENNIEFRFGFLSFNAPYLNVRFRLAADHSWTYTTERAIRFFSLQPGDYSLQLQYSIDNINWKDATLSLPIHIQPPLWERWYIQLIVFVFIISLTLTYFLLQLKYSRQRQAYLKAVAKHTEDLLQMEFDAVEKERNRIAKDLHDGIGGSLLTLKMMTAEALQKENAGRDAIASQFQDTLSELKHIIFDLSPPGLSRYGLIASLQTYINKLQTGSKLKIELETYGNEIINEKIRIVLFRVIQELLTNSLKHSQASLIKIQINSFNDLINIIFEDNGVGMPSDAENGTGLHSIQYRIEKLNGTFQLQSEGKGFSALIDIPIESEND